MNTDPNVSRIKEILMRQMEIMYEVVEKINSGELPEYHSTQPGTDEYCHAKAIEQVSSIIAHIAKTYSAFL